LAIQTNNVRKDTTHFYSCESSADYIKPEHSVTRQWQIFVCAATISRLCKSYSGFWKYDKEMGSVYIYWNSNRIEWIIHVL